MWETISTVLTSANAWQVLIFLAIAVFIFVILVQYILAVECPGIKEDEDEWRAGELAFEPEQIKIFVRRLKDNCVVCLLP